MAFCGRNFITLPDTPWRHPGYVTNLRLEIIALNQEDYYIALDLLGELKTVYISAPKKPDLAFPNLVSQTFPPLVFISMQIIFPICILKYVYAVSYNMKLYNYEVTRQAMAKNPSLLRNRRA